MPEWRLPKLAELSWAIGWVENFQDRLPASGLPLCEEAVGEPPAAAAAEPHDDSPEARARAVLTARRPLGDGQVYVPCSKCRTRGCKECHRLTVDGRPWGFVERDADDAELKAAAGVYYTKESLKNVKASEAEFYKLWENSTQAEELREEMQEQSGKPVATAEVLKRLWVNIVRYVTQAVEQCTEAV
jgi:hypothetical protein